MKKTVNCTVRQAIAAAKLPLWRVADELHCHENTLIRLLRHELSEDQRQRVLDAIERAKANKEGE